MFDQLSTADRLLLLQFLCAFAWTDLEVSDRERRFVHRVVERTRLGAEEARQVEQWLAIAPSPGDTDPARIPPEHRRVFLDAIRALVYVDGSVDAEERENLDRLASALGLA